MITHTIVIKKISILDSGFLRFYVRIVLERHEEYSTERWYNKKIPSRW